jgi:hypothetical protein
LITIRQLILMQATIIIGTAALPTRSEAQWWAPRAPSDFEECAARADKDATSKEARATLISQCETNFAGRRKPGGGYTYYDFMQDRHFDIAGPNPTPEEQKRIDEQYTVYLDKERRSIIAAAFSEKQKQQELESLQRSTTAPATATVPTPVPRPRLKPSVCQENSFSCGWSRLSSSVDTLAKTLLGPPASAAKKSARSREQLAQSRN